MSQTCSAPAVGSDPTTEQLFELARMLMGAVLPATKGLSREQIQGLIRKENPGEWLGFYLSNLDLLERERNRILRIIHPRFDPVVAKALSEEGWRIVRIPTWLTVEDFLYKPSYQKLSLPYPTNEYTVFPAEIAIPTAEIGLFLSDAMSGVTAPTNTRLREIYNHLKRYNMFCGEKVRTDLFNVVETLWLLSKIEEEFVFSKGTQIATSTVCTNPDNPSPSHSPYYFVEKVVGERGNWRICSSALVGPALRVPLVLLPA